VEVQAFEHELDPGCHQRRALERAEERHPLAQARDVTDALEVLLRAHLVRHLHPPARLEVLGHLLERLDLQVLVPDLEDGAVDQAVDQVPVLLVLAHVLELDLAGHRGEHGRQVGEARDDLALAGADGTLLGVREQALVVVDGDAHAHARGLVDLVRAARLEGELGDDLLDEERYADLAHAAIEHRHLLLHDGDLVGERARVVGPDLDVEPVLQRRDDPPPARVVFGVGAGHDDDVEGQPDLVALDLDVLLLHQVEEPDLHLLGEIGELVDREDAAVGPRDESIVDRLLVGEVAALGHLHRVDLADQVGHRHVGSGELLPVPVLGSDPGDRQRVTLHCQPPAARPADRVERRIVDWAAVDHRHERVEQRGEAADDPALRLASLAEENHVVSGEDRVLDVGDHRIVVADDAGKDAFLPPESCEEVAPHLLADRQHPVSRNLELTQRARCVGTVHEPPLPRVVEGLYAPACARNN